MLRPPSLQPGDTIAIIPTARAVSRDELRDGILLAESWGLRVKIGEGVGRKDFQQAGSAEERAADLQRAINDPEVRAIWCARGGYGTMQPMPYLDLAPLLHDLKWIIGFSDITVLHNALHNMGLCSLHAQMPHMIGGKSAEAKETLRCSLFGQEVVVRCSLEHPPEQRTTNNEQPRVEPGAGPATNRPGQCTAPLVGGNLSMLYALRGTAYDIDPRGKILFIEDLDELLYHLDRMVMNLKLSGWFEGLAGLVVGGMHEMRDKNTDDPFGLDAEGIITRAIEGTAYPVCFGFPAGHQHDNRALVMGSNAKLSVTANGATLSFVSFGGV